MAFGRAKKSANSTFYLVRIWRVGARRDGYGCFRIILNSLFGRRSDAAEETGPRRWRTRPIISAVR